MYKYIILLILFFSSPAIAEEVPPDYVAPHRIEFETPLGIQMNSFYDLPYDYAKYLIPELYYFWALNHNEQQYKNSYFTTQSGTLQISEDVSIFGRPTVNSQTTIRQFNPHIGTGARMIYNPYSQ